MPPPRSTPARPRRRWRSSHRGGGPAAVRLWRNAWSEFIPFLDCDVEDHKIISRHECDRVLNATSSAFSRRSRASSARPSSPRTSEPGSAARRSWPTQLLDVPSLDPRSRATCAIDFPDCRTIRTHRHGSQHRTCVSSLASLASTAVPPRHEGNVRRAVKSGAAAWVKEQYTITPQRPVVAPGRPCMARGTAHVSLSGQRRPALRVVRRARANGTTHDRLRYDIARPSLASR